MVALDVGLAGHLAEGVLAGAAEAFGEQGVVVEFVLLVAVGVDAGALREDVLAHNGSIGGAVDAGVGFDHATDGVEALLVDVGPDVGLVVEDGDDAGQSGVARTFAEAVHRAMDAAESGLSGL
jgi:hypothetical protein